MTLGEEQVEIIGIAHGKAQGVKINRGRGCSVYTTQVYYQLFINKYPDFVVGSAYQTYAIVLLTRKPPKFSGKWTGTGFNYGSTNILENCPNDILILAEDD